MTASATKQARPTPSQVPATDDKEQSFRRSGRTAPRCGSALDRGDGVRLGCEVKTPDYYKGEDMEAVIAFFGGAVGGALITQLVTLGRNSFETRVRRRSYARMLHEDFLRQQSTVARAYYRSTDSAPVWWKDEEFLNPLATADVYGDLLGALHKQRYVAVASALGWMEYLRAASKAKQPERPRGELLKAYRRLGTARYALAKLGRFEYREHDHDQMREDEAPASELNFPRQRAEESLAELKTGAQKAERPTAVTDLKEDFRKPESGA